MRAPLDTGGPRPSWVAPLLAASWLLLGSCALGAQEVVVFRTYRSMAVAGHRVQGEWTYLRLPEGELAVLTRAILQFRNEPAQFTGSAAPSPPPLSAPSPQPRAAWRPEPAPAPPAAEDLPQEPPPEPEPPPPGPVPYKTGV